MSERRIERALAQLARRDAVLAPAREGGFGVYPHGDRRRRPTARLNALEVRGLAADGAIEALSDGSFELAEAGMARVRRETAEPGEAFVAQHAAIVDRSVIDKAGDIHTLRGLDPDPVIRRLAGLRGPWGRAWLDEAELAAAATLRRNWLAAQIGLVRGTDWTAAPIGSGPRGACNAQEIAMARHCDASRRVSDALQRLTPCWLRGAVERVCLHEEAIEALEREQGWPTRSGKLALKLGLAQLAVAL